MMMGVKLSEWARASVVGRQSALAGSMPVCCPSGRQPFTGTIRVDEPRLVEHRYRLAAFGVEYLEAALAAKGRRLVVDDAEVDDDLVKDMVEVLRSFCARLGGRPSATRGAESALAATGQAAA